MSSKFIGKEPCPKCHSKDNLARYDDGHAVCFSVACGYYEASKGKSMTTTTQHGARKHTPISSKYRSISLDTLRKYGTMETEGTIDFAYADKTGAVVAWKCRDKAEKSFFVAGKWGDVSLFGQQLFTPGSAKAVTITEGELDAMSAFEIMGSKYPVVSIGNGAQSAVKNIKENYEWLDSFDSVYICFDNDGPGRDAAKAAAEVIGSKAKIVKLTDYKDANEYLTNNKREEFSKLWWKAEAFVPDGIIPGNTLWDVVNAPVEKAAAMYPFDGLNRLTYGLRYGELVLFTAGTGLGKSQVLREIVYGLISQTKDNIGLMFLEESVKKTGRSLMSLAIDTPLHYPDVQVPSTKLREAFDSTLGTGRVFLFDHFGSSNVDNIISRVRYMAKGLDCKWVFLDHISIVVSSQEYGDERKALDEIMTKLRQLVQETGIGLIAVSHLKRPEKKGHEEGAETSLGQLRGSGAIGQLSDFVIGLERNSQAENIAERNTTKVRVLKSRTFGLTGPACSLLYTQADGRMREIKDTL